MNLDLERLRGSGAVRALYFATSESLQERILQVDPAIRDLVAQIRMHPDRAAALRTALVQVFNSPPPEGRRHPEETVLTAGLQVLSETAPAEASLAADLFENAPPIRYGLLGRFARWTNLRRRGGAPMLSTRSTVAGGPRLITDGAELATILRLDTLTDPTRSTSTASPQMGILTRSR